MADILTSAADGLAILTLNRPDALHALNTHMCRNMAQALLNWRDDPSIKAILIEHAPGTRGFCAGGDIRMIQESGKGDGAAAREFFFTEYQLNHLLFTYPKPIVAIMDGITMGGGVGVSMPAKYRIATERTLFAMPETGIGLFPDVGGGWFLPRLPGQVGMWLALTGARLKAADCLIAGVATHYMPSEIVAAARAQIAGAAQTHDAARALASGLDALAEGAGAPQHLTPDNQAHVDRLFAGASVEAVLAQLDQDGGDWARMQAKVIRTKSPQTLKVAFRQLSEGAGMNSFADEMRQEYRIACRVIHRHDFIEGVRTVVIDKGDEPRWSPDTLDGVTDAMLDDIFAALPPGEEWRPLVD